MSVGQATDTVSAWLTDTLRGSAPLMAKVAEVFEDLAIEAGFAYPFVLYEFQAALADTRVIPTIPILANPIYRVRVVDKATDYSRTRPAYAIVDGLLNGVGNITVAETGGCIVSCVRKTPYEWVEIVGGTGYRSSGGLYQLQVQ